MGAPVMAASGGRLADACYLGLRLAGWFAVTVCIVVTVWIGFFVFLGEFSFTETMLHIDNFASRYLAADDARRASFRGIFWMISAGLFAVFGLFRRHALPAFRLNGKENEHG